MDSGFGDDVGIQSVAKVDRVDVITAPGQLGPAITTLSVPF